MIVHRVWGRAAVAAGVLCASLAIGACGESEGGDGNGDGAASAANEADQASSTPPSGGRDAVAQVMRDLRTAYNDTDGKAFCAELTPEGQQEVREFAASIPELRAKSCDGFITAYSSRVVAAGAPQPPVRVLRVSIDGEKATIAMKGGMASIRKTTTYKLAHQEGEWKLVNPISGAKTRR